MTGVLTIKGVRRIEKMKNRPKDWKEMVINYLTWKEEWIIRLRVMGKDYHEPMLDYAEAMAIANRMGLVWRPNITR